MIPEIGSSANSRYIKTYMPKQSIINRNFMYRRLFVLTCIALSFATLSADAQDIESLTRAYPDTLCSSCADWNAPQDPFRIHHNTFFVGTHGLSSILITSPDGHILIDAALPNSAPSIMENVHALGFDIADISLILNSHAHFDHAGGVAAIQQASGAEVAASPASASVLERGSGGPDDPQYGVLLDFPAVVNVEQFTPGDTLRVGSIQIMSHATAGHTPGGTSWSWRSCDGESCLDIVYADSQTPVSADGFRFTDSKTYSTALEDFERGFHTLEQMSCDILITTHPGASSFWERMADGPEGLIDSDACRRYAASARKQLQKRVEMEAAEPESR